MVSIVKKKREREINYRSLSCYNQNIWLVQTRFTERATV